MTFKCNKICERLIGCSVLNVYHLHYVGLVWKVQKVANVCFNGLGISYNMTLTSTISNSTQENLRKMNFHLPVKGKALLIIFMNMSRYYALCTETVYNTMKSFQKWYLQHIYVKKEPPRV